MRKKIFSNTTWSMFQTYTKQGVNMNRIVVEDIHTEFTEAEELLMNEVNEILTKAGREEYKKLVKAINKVGFINSANSLEFTTSFLANAEAKANQIKAYKLSYPGHKFITEQKCVEICKKYNLVMASAPRFTERIPIKNMHEIAEFKYDKATMREVVDFAWVTGNNKSLRLEEMTEDHIVNALRRVRQTVYQIQHGSRFGVSGLKHGEEERLLRVVYYMERELDRREVPEIFREDSSIESANIKNKSLAKTLGQEFWVCGDETQFDLSDAYIDENNRAFTLSSNTKELRQIEAIVKDPIVLAPVKFGWIIVTAWGDEASDPEVHEPQLN